MKIFIAKTRGACAPTIECDGDLVPAVGVEIGDLEGLITPKSKSPLRVNRIHRKARGLVGTDDEEVIGSEVADFDFENHSWVRLVKQLRGNW